MRNDKTTKKLCEKLKNVGVCVFFKGCYQEDFSPLGSPQLGKKSLLGKKFQLVKKIVSIWLENKFNRGDMTSMAYNFTNKSKGSL